MSTQHGKYSIEITGAISVDGSEYFPIVQGGTTKRAAIGLILGDPSPGTTELASRASRRKPIAASSG